MRLSLALLAGLALPVTATAHPHVFVKAYVTVVFDDAGGVGVKLDWYYDDLFSLLVTSDLGLDVDGDLILTAQEQVRLETEIAAWPPDFAGDLDVRQNGVVVGLQEKENHQMRYVEGLFHEEHVRPLAPTIDSNAPFQIRVYDPAFYTAYDLQTPVLIEGRDDCTVDVVRADLDAAYALVTTLLEDIPAEEVVEYDIFPEVGDAFADTIVVTCAGPL